ncbi:hypothetical protein MPSEU_000492800 [Mayamaea pseudoterrestris]|nr:hypothetical protein MPSEU_000492800 [Mayamaea pseudoterrestris]
MPDETEMKRRVIAEVQPEEGDHGVSEPIFTNEFVQDSFQSLARVSLAGFGGSLVGYGLEKQQQQRPYDAAPIQQKAYAFDHNRRSRNSRNHFQSRPPATIGAGRSAASHANLPAAWALSCSFFVLILETSRRTSPTRLILHYAHEHNISIPLSSNKYQRQALISTGDYALGGIMAGLAATVARKTPVRWGMGMGLTLGCLAGLVQAGLDVAEIYLLDQP